MYCLYFSLMEEWGPEVVGIVYSMNLREAWRPDATSDSGMIRNYENLLQNILLSSGIVYWVGFCYW